VTQPAINIDKMDIFLKRTKPTNSEILLSIPIPTTPLPPSQPFHPQSQSSFFVKLPFEIRLLIYQAVIDDTPLYPKLAIHIVNASQLVPPAIVPWIPSSPPPPPSQQLTCIPCASALGDPFLISGTHYGHWPRGHIACSQLAKWKMEKVVEPYAKLAMLRTCQRMYVSNSLLLR
jgi:hypothetical protein